MRRSFRTTSVFCCLASLALAGCSTLTLEPTECESDTQCAEAFGAGSVCADSGYCKVSEGDCTSSAECPEFSICRKSDFTCTSLLSNECLEVFGDYKNDNAIFVGVVSPLRGNDEGYGRSILNGFRMGLSDIESTVNGLPPAEAGGSRRPFVAIGCSDDANADTAVLAADFLANQVEVPAIAGAAYSGVTIAMTTEVTQPAGVFTFSPSATSIAITDLADDGLLWRTAPSDVLQAAALAAFSPVLEQRIRDEAALQATDSVGFVMLNKDDAFGAGISTAFEGQAQLNGGPAITDGDNYTRFSYGNPDDEATSPTDFPGAVQTVLDRKPHIVAIMGTAEVFELITSIEAGWDDSALRPQYLLADGAVQSPLWDDVIGSNDGLRRRVQGSIPGVASGAFDAFRSAYNSAFDDGISSPESFGAAGAYDIAYMLFYATSTVTSQPITGANLAAAMGRLVEGTPSEVGRNQITRALQTLAGGDSIDFVGASGPLDFDLATGEAPSDIQIWCIPDDGAGNAATARQSGVVYSAATLQLDGSTFSEDCDRN